MNHQNGIKLSDRGGVDNSPTRGRQKPNRAYLKHQN